MKKLLLLLLLPLGAFAQEVQPDPVKPKAMKWEVGLNNALAFAIDDDDLVYDDLFLAGRNSVSIYHNFKTIQLGLVAEGGLIGVGEDWYMSPQLVVNYKMPFGRWYAYGGGALGYIRETVALRSPKVFNGTVAGIQAGGVYSVSKRFGLNIEAGARIKHVTATVSRRENAPGGGTIDINELSGYTDLYFPLSVGVRYRF